MLLHSATFQELSVQCHAYRLELNCLDSWSTEKFKPNTFRLCSSSMVNFTDTDQYICSMSTGSLLKQAPKAQTISSKASSLATNDHQKAMQIKAWSYWRHNLLHQTKFQCLNGLDICLRMLFRTLAPLRLRKGPWTVHLSSTCCNNIYIQVQHVLWTANINNQKMTLLSGFWCRTESAFILQCLHHQYLSSKLAATFWA